MGGSKEMFPSLHKKPLPSGRGSVALASGLIAVVVAAGAQTLPVLTLQQAEEMAVKNHPQVQAAQNEVNYANQQIVISRAAYYPDVTGDVTGSEGNDFAR